MPVQIARNIRNDIAAGVLRNGDVLPSTRELATQWDVSVFTISEAMKILTTEGLVLSKSRSKRVVQAPEQDRQRSPKPAVPQVLLIGGYAGSGKSELGRILARRTGWAILDKDSLTRPVVEAALEILELSPNDRESEPYIKLIRPREYEALITAALENLECGNSIIVTAPFIRELSDVAWTSRTLAAFAGQGARTTVVWVYCDPATMHIYLRHRGAARDTAKLAEWPSYLDTIDTDFRPETPHVVVDNSASSTPLQEQADQLLRSLGAIT
jgi:predicted kinase